jgi:hypothetical protein
MRIKFNTRKSGFYNEIKSALEDSSLDSEVTVLSNENYSYVEEEIEVFLSDKDESGFKTDWWKAQAGLFPARIKAVCTVLRDLKLYGNYRIKNNSRGLSVSKMSTSDLESHFSWNIISKTTAVKQLDRSAFVHRSTGIPAEILWFFDIGEEGPASDNQTLVHQGTEYNSKTHLDNRGSYQLLWKADFTELIQSKLPTFFKIHQDGETPNQNAWLQFKKLGANRYEVSFATEKAENEVRSVPRSNTQGSGKVPVSGYWTFISKPKIWKDVYQVIQEKEVFTHQVRDCDVSSVLPGHLGIMRVGIDQRNATERNGEAKRPAGVYAIVEITSEAYLRPEEPIANLDQTEEKQRRTHIVDIRFIKKLVSDPLTIDSLKTQSGITDKYLIDSFQGSSIPLNQESFEELVRLANADDEIDAQLDKDLKNKSDKEIAKKYRNPNPRMVKRVSRKWERGNEGEEVKKLAGRKCQISEAMGLTPYSFQKKNGDNYCEAHHVVPVSSGKDGTLHPSNVICVSADRHRQLHYGNAKVVDIRDDEFEFLIDGKTVIVPKLIKREFT